ncbi:hypothetical protein GGR56DRAFT_620820 [Xylariaceae sp. FL0804]|nr:hypothetical protein GGR56DRAFT_620820 [Xylariaceae sp. FL0804]
MLLSRRLLPAARPLRRRLILTSRPFCLPLHLQSVRFTSTTPQPHEFDEHDTMPPKPGKIDLKVPKGTKDWSGTDMIVREKIFSVITEVFKKFEGEPLDTPAFELREILAGKYGEDSKLIYDLADQGGEITSLRYDLTVPFARWLAMNKNVQNMRRYQIAKVYRRDQPAMTKGRMREFYQCDFDIAGAYDSMMPDAEIIKLVKEVFNALGWQGNYTVKLNHRKILDGIFAVCGVPEDKIRTISSAVDKLDKLPWEDVRKEMVAEKGLAEETADRIGEWVVLKGGRDLLERLKSDEKMAANESMKQGMADLEEMFDMLEWFNALDIVSFDLSLARGLDYYTGVIYEVVTEGSAPSTTPAPAEVTPAPNKKKNKQSTDPDEDRSSDPSIGVGSVAAGGRYDNLVGMFSGKTQIPCVGVSFGIERIFSIIKAKMEREGRWNQVRAQSIDAYVMAFGGKGFNGLSKDRATICQTLEDAGISAKFLMKKKPKLPAQFQAAEERGAPFAVLFGEEELAQGKVKIKEMGLPDGHPEKDGVLVNRSDVVQELKDRLSRRQRPDDGVLF